VRSLFADITQAAASSVPTTSDEVRDVRDAVLAHLKLLFATLRGTVWPAKDYGVEDATRIFHEYPGSVEEFRGALEGAIRRYEPRLQNASVRHVMGDDLVLRLDIHATLLAGGRSVPVRFTSRFDGACRVDVR
jgi:type VI secretion system lysozyme-like protein